MQKIEQILKEKALNLGFEDLGIAKVEILSDEILNFKKWLEFKYNATMAYMERNIEKRENIELILPGAKSVIVTATNYFHPAQHNNNDEFGKISRYAWGDDYHEIILEKLETLALVLKEIYPGNHYKCYVDTGPILERQWALRAGIGWQGKNGLIISKKFGSWFFLGIIITDVELEPTLKNAIEFEKIKNGWCGSCNKCMEACPTNAIVAPSVVDSGKCISYWTIEAKPDLEIPVHIRENQNGWLFGCDICQEVCPWNVRHSIISKDESFKPRLSETSLKLCDIHHLSKDEFASRFKKSPVKRTKLEGLIRNAKSLLK